MHHETRPAGHPDSDQEKRVKRLRSLPVGWTALGIIIAGVIYAVVATVTGRLDYGTAGFVAAVILIGTLLGLAGWDLFVGLMAMRGAAYLALPRKLTGELPRWAVPYLSPIAFLIGLLVGHEYWH